MASNRSVHARNVQKKLIYLLCAQMMFPMGAYAIGGTTIVISLSMQLVWMQQAAKCLAAKYPAAKCLAAKCLAAKSPATKCRRCEMSGCQMSGSRR
ncbi:hypothetical protein L3Y34_012964 [Caenorhabditis briggsae]|uniref:Uncharacterized protein n=1 Tax=Caenorhabditis briggsae TaxID=6238 RepID=A0AAE8ZTQ4_CAEBR|nr:hypothetical protein L3Y34_012964 [Caenorhabditis briggsae]